MKHYSVTMPEIGVKAEAHRDRAVAVGNKRRFQRQAVGAECGHEFEPVAEREDREEVPAGPLEPGREAVLPRFSQLPGEQGPRHAVHWKPVLVEVEEWRRWIEHHLPPRGAIAGAHEAVRPRMKKRDPSGATFCCGDLKVLHAL